MAEKEKSRILIIGATGFIGKEMAKASVELGHPTFALVRPTSMNDPNKSQQLMAMKNGGITLLQGSLDDYESLIDALKRVDVVISCVGIDFADPSHKSLKGAGNNTLLKQLQLIKAIKQVGNIKRFLPSEFGYDVKKAPPATAPAIAIIDAKLRVRQEVEASGIPYTYVACNGMAAYFVANLGQAGLTSPPIENVLVYGDGNTKVCAVEEGDIAKYTVLCVDDERTLNKTLHVRPPANTLTQNEMIHLWEQKIHKSLNKTFISEEALVEKIKETGTLYFDLALSIFVRGANTKSSVEDNGVEATALYPQVKYVTVDEYLDRFLRKR